MPISAENKKLYPDNWKQISLDIRNNRAKNKCEFCGVLNHSWIKRTKNGDYIYATSGLINRVFDKINEQYSKRQALKFFNLTEVVLTVAHLDHNPANCDYDNLKALCQRCHLKYDAKHHKQTRYKSRFKNCLKLEL